MAADGEPRVRYYGWIVAWTGFAILSLAYGIQYCFGVFLPSIAADLNVERSAATWAFALYVFVYSANSVVSGWLTDRYGPRLVLTIGAGFLTVGYLLASQARTLLQLTLSLGVVAAIGMSAVFVPCNATVVRWFLHHRGRALAISTSGSSFAAVLLPPVMGLFIDDHSWRTLYIIAALLVGATVLAGSRLMVRDPEAKGLSVTDELDGKPAPATTSAIDRISLTASQAARTTEFWLIVMIFLTTWLVVFVPLIHLSPYAKDAGASSEVGAWLVSAIGLGGLVGRGLSGSASDRLGRLATLSIVLVLQVVAFLAFAASSHPVVLFPTAALFGFAYGGATVLFPAIVGDRFGRAYAGAIVGSVFATAGSLGALGPPVAGLIRDATDSYRWSFVICAAINALSIGFVICLRLLTPERNAERTPSDPSERMPLAQSPT